MKPFNLEEAKAGKPICTRGGRSARILCTDFKSMSKGINIVAAVLLAEGFENIYTYTNEGLRNGLFISNNDLMMVDEEPKCPFKPFDKVLVRDTNINKWECDIFNRYNQEIEHPFDCLTDIYAQCIPYNEETEHLIGTTDDAPGKYVIW